MNGTPTKEMDGHLANDTMLVPIADAAGSVTVPAVREIVQRATPMLRQLAGAGE
jgi:hypothetical protein